MRIIHRTFPLYLLACFLLMGCQRSMDGHLVVEVPSTTSTTTITTTTASMVTQSSNATLGDFVMKQGETLTFSMEEGETWTSTDGAFAFFEDSLFSETFEGNKTIYRRYDLQMKKWHLAGETKIITLGAASNVVTPDNIMFVSNAYEEEDGFSLMRMDLFASVLQPIEHFDWMPSFQYLELVDDHTFLIYGPKHLEDNRYSYYINRYDIITGEMTTLIEKPNSDIEGISCYDYNDGKIYAVEFIVGQPTEVLQEYSMDGVPQKKYDLSPVRNYIGDGDAIWSIEVFGDYVMCWTLQRHRFVMMKIEGDKLIEVGTFNGDKVRLVQPIKGVGDFGLLFNQTEKFIVRYDTGEKCFVQHELGLLPHTSVKGCLVDEKGNILFFLSFEDEQGNNDVRYYLINFNNL